MKTAIVGCGNISRCHFSALSQLQGVDLAAAVDIRPERAEQAANEWNCRAYTDYLQMLDAVRPDAVHLCTPHDLHVPMAIEALRRGIHVLSEKPCAIRAEELEALRKAQQASKAQYGVCFQNRFLPGVRQAKRMLQEKALGALQAAAARVYWCREADYYVDDWHGDPVREGGGVLVNQAVHTLDLLQDLFGEEVECVTAHIANDHLKGVTPEEDNASVLLQFKNGGKAMLHATTAFALNADVLIDLFCENGVLRLQGGVLYLLLPNDEPRRLTARLEESGVGRDYWGAGHPALIRDFYRCIENGEPFLPDACTGGIATQLFLAAYASAAKGEPVNLSYRKTP